jgi:hypothetical protein
MLIMLIIINKVILNIAFQYLNSNVIEGIIFDF